MVLSTQFYRSQVGDTSVINYSYTDSPWKLLAKDIYYFFVYLWALPWVLMPLWPSGELDELYAYDWRNWYCVVAHFVLCVMQLVLFLALPFTLLLPIWTAAGGIAIFLFVNWLICLTLNGSDIKFNSEEKYAPALPEHEHEQWVFLNGVAVG